MVVFHVQTAVAVPVVALRSCKPDIVDQYVSKLSKLHSSDHNADQHTNTRSPQQLPVPTGYAKVFFDLHSIVTLIETPPKGELSHRERL